VGRKGCYMRSIKGSPAGLVLAGILAITPTAAFAHGGGGGHGGGHAFGQFTGRAISPGFNRTGGFSTGRFSGRGDHGRHGDLGFRDHRTQFASPGYFYPYYSYDNSYLDYGPDNDTDYQYGDNSAGSVQPDSSGPVVDQGPVVVTNSRPMDSRANTAHIDSAYNSTDATGQQRIVNQDPNEKIGTRAGPSTFVPPAVPKPPQTAAKGTQTTPQARAGAFGNLVLVSWLENAGKDVIYVQNTETNEVQKITSEPNLDNFRIVEVHQNADPKLFEVVISNGSQQGPIRFRF